MERIFFFPFLSSGSSLNPDTRKSGLWHTAMLVLTFFSFSHPFPPWLSAQGDEMALPLLKTPPPLFFLFWALLPPFFPFFSSRRTAKLIHRPLSRLPFSLPFLGLFCGDYDKNSNLFVFSFLFFLKVPFVCIAKRGKAPE